MSTAGSGKFSSDRTIKQYAQQIWNIKASASARVRVRGAACGLFVSCEVLIVLPLPIAVSLCFFLSPTCSLSPPQPVRRPGPVSVSVERLGTLGIINSEGAAHFILLHPSYPHFTVLTSILHLTSADFVSPGSSPSNVISLERMTPTLSVSPKMINREYFNPNP